MTQPDHADYLPKMTTSVKMFLVLTTLVGGAGLVALSQLGPGPGEVPSHRPAPADKEQRVGPADDVQAALDRLAEGWTLVLAPGRYAGLRLINKHGIVVRGETGAVIAADGDPALVLSDCVEVVLRELQLRFESRERTFPALLIRDSNAVRVEGCELISERGDGLVAENSPGLQLRSSAVRATEWGLRLSGCSQAELTQLKIEGCTNQGGILLRDSAGVSIARLQASGNRIGLRVEQGGVVGLKDCQIGGPGDVGLKIAGEAEVTIDGESRISGNDTGIDVDSGGSLVVAKLELTGNAFLGIKVRRGVRALDLTGLSWPDQINPLRLDGTLEPGWKVPPQLRN